jgi:putative holliday junction resolvase
MSRIPRVFTKSKRINHFLWDNCADFHRAGPFQASDQTIMTIISHNGNPSNAIVSMGYIVSKNCRNAMNVFLRYTMHMRYLGIDFGAKRVGIAISEPSGSFAFPMSVLENSDELVFEIKKLCDEHDIGEIVVGESKDFTQKENEIMKKIAPFVESLKKETGLPVYMHPEFLTSLEASQIQGTNDMHDASAAALILKSYLDTKNNDNNR